MRCRAARELLFSGLVLVLGGAGAPSWAAEPAPPPVLGGSEEPDAEGEIPGFLAQGEPAQLPGFLARGGSEGPFLVGYRAESRRAAAGVGASRREVYPNLTGEIVVEIQNDHSYSAQGGSDGELNDLFATVEPAFALALSEAFSLNTSLVFEPVEDPEPGESREFDRQGLFVEELYANWQLEGLGLRAGKFNPHFGRAWALAPGLYGVDFAEDYELTERVGAGASYALQSETLGQHTLSGEAFTADTSHLSRSVVRGRSRLRRSDGGASNTGRLNSYALALEGEAIPALSQLTYNLGYVYQAAGEDGRIERDFVAGLTYGASPWEELDLEFLSEYAVLDDFGGMADVERRYWTGSSSASYRDWVLALSYTLRDEDLPAARDNEDFLFQGSLGYFRELGLGQGGLEVAYLNTREENLKTSTVGLRLSWNFAF